MNETTLFAEGFARGTLLVAVLTATMLAAVAADRYFRRHRTAKWLRYVGELVIFAPLLALIFMGAFALSPSCGAVAGGCGPKLFGYVMIVVAYVWARRVYACRLRRRRRQLRRAVWGYAGCCVVFAAIYGAIALSGVSAVAHKAVFAAATAVIAGLLAWVVALLVRGWRGSAGESGRAGRLVASALLLAGAVAVAWLMMRPVLAWGW